MRRILASMAATVAAVSFSLLLTTGASAVTVGTAPGIKRALAETSAVEKVVRVCRHQFWTSRRVCYIDRSRPPTVCHHIRNSSRRDCY
jgi:ABC-type phosphate transport system permease subunit